MSRSKVSRVLFSFVALVALIAFALPQGSSRAAKEIVLWGDWTGEGESQIMVMVDAFNKSQTDVVVKYVPTQDIITKFLTAATSGGAPDAIVWDRFRTSLYAPKGVLKPIDDYMAKDNISKDGFFAEALRELSDDGKLYGLPMTVDARALFYNKKILDEAGVKPPTTWEELAEAAKKLTVRDSAGKLTRAGFTVGDVGLFNMYLQQAGGSMLSEDGQKTNFNNEKGLAVLAFWDRLINKDKVYEVGFESGLGEGQDAFVTGKVAMQYNGPWMLNGYKKYGKELEFGVVPPPKGPNGDTGSVMGGFGLAIPSGAKNPDEAWKFISFWLANPDNALLWAKTSNNIPGNLQTLKDDFFQKDPYLKPFVDTLNIARIRPPVAGYAPMEGDALIPQLQLYASGKVSAADALKQAQADGDKVLEENNIK
jgi:multiple sugar transport system substrate-binding protein